MSNRVHQGRVDTFLVEEVDQLSSVDRIKSLCQVYKEQVVLGSFFGFDVSVDVLLKLVLAKFEDVVYVTEVMQGRFSRNESSLVLVYQVQILNLIFKFLKNHQLIQFGDCW